MPYSSYISLRNRWGIPTDLARRVVARDLQCIYCANSFDPINGNRSKCASWEHIVNDLNLINLENIALCCVGCNSSKGVKSLSVWLTSKYCTQRGITKASLSLVASDALGREQALLAP